MIERDRRYGAAGRRTMRGWCSPALALLLAATGCERHDDGTVQGYVEGEFVFVASPYAGELQKLAVQRGAEVRQGDPLFELDDSVERASLDEAGRRVAQSRANLEERARGAGPRRSRPSRRSSGRRSPRAGFRSWR
jgi:HlyD family secretion protein